MDEKRRNFFASVVQQSKQLSECIKPKASLIVRGESIYGIGYNKAIISGAAGGEKHDKDYYETSPVFDAIKQDVLRGNIEYAGQEVRGNKPGRGVAFLSYFPHIDEIKLLYQAGIFTIYFFGDIDDEDSVNLMNNITDSDGEPVFKVIQLL